MHRRRPPKARTLEAVIRSWWEHRFGTPDNDQRFLERPLAEHYAAMVAELWAKRDALDAELDDTTLPAPMRDYLSAELEGIEIALGLRTGAAPSTTGDPLGDFWMRKMQAGEELTEEDLELTLEDLEQMRREGKA